MVTEVRASIPGELAVVLDLDEVSISEFVDDASVPIRTASRQQRDCDLSGDGIDKTDVEDRAAIAGGVEALSRTASPCVCFVAMGKHATSTCVETGMPEEDFARDSARIQANVYRWFVQAKRMLIPTGGDSENVRCEDEQVGRSEQLVSFLVGQFQEIEIVRLHKSCRIDAVDLIFKGQHF